MSVLSRSFRKTCVVNSCVEFLVVYEHLNDCVPITHVELVYPLHQRFSLCSQMILYTCSKGGDVHVVSMFKQAYQMVK